MGGMGNMIDSSKFCHDGQSTMTQQIRTSEDDWSRWSGAELGSNMLATAQSLTYVLTSPSVVRNAQLT